MSPQLSRRHAIRALGAVSASLGALSLASCSRSPSRSDDGTTPSAPVSGVLTAGVAWDTPAAGFDPRWSLDPLMVAVNWHVFEGLMEIDPATGKVYPALAEDTPEQTGELTYRVRLRDGAAFSDGARVQAWDVSDCFAHALDRAHPCVYTCLLNDIDTVTALDERTLEIRLAYPSDDYLQHLALVKIMPPRHLTREEDSSSPLLTPVGTGPFVLQDTGASTQRMVFGVNPHYTGPRPSRVERMEWQILTDNDTRSKALSKGTVSVIDSAGEAPSSDTISYEMKRGNGALSLVFNLHGRCGDLRNRQAVMYAIDRKQLCQKGYDGIATPATDVFAASHPAYERATLVYEYIPQRATELIEQTGLTSLRVLIHADSFSQRAQQMVVDQLDALGISVSATQLLPGDARNIMDTDPQAWDVLITSRDVSSLGADAQTQLRWWLANPRWLRRTIPGAAENLILGPGPSDDQEEAGGLVDGLLADDSATAAPEATPSTPAPEPTRGTVEDTPEAVADSSRELVFLSMIDAGARLHGQAQVAQWRRCAEEAAQRLHWYPLVHTAVITAYRRETLSGFRPLSQPGLYFLDVSVQED